MGKNLNIREEIINQRQGAHRVSLEDKEKLRKIIDDLHKEDLFDKYEMSYAIREDDKYISIVLHKEINFFR